MFYFAIVFTFILGSVVGSFINALEYRITKGKSIKGRSFCPNCKHKLAWFDLIPFFSYLYLQGKCRYCKKKISFQYPLIEFITGITFLIALFSTNLINTIYNFNIWDLQLKSVLFILLSTFFSASILVALHDAKTTYVLQKPIYFSFVAVILYHISNIYYLELDFKNIIPFVLSGFIAYLFFYGLHYFSKGRWMGDGDAQIAGLIGLYLGYIGTIISLYFAFILGSIYGIYLIKKNIATMKSEMAFGEFLYIGMFLSILFTEKIVDIYVKMFL